MKEKKELSRKELMQQIAKTTREALYSQWEKDGYFWDYNNFYGKGQGVLSDAMGLTAVMLLYLRFSEDEAVWGGVSNDFMTVEIVTKSLDFIYKSVSEDGYSVKPLCSNDDINDVINKEHGYVDTITWVLSSSVLVTYAIRKGLLSIDSKFKDYALELLADSLARLMDAQLENGSWGFSTDKGCKTSLYFTYAAATALADCFDYLLGELEYYDQKDDQKIDITNYYDVESLKAINEYYRRDLQESVAYYPTDSVEKAINATRSKLQEWLLKNLIPSLPDLANCNPLSEEERECLGIPEQLNPKEVLKFGNKDYINLYYSFYAIDILTTSSTDKRYEAIVNGNDPSLTLTNLKELYKSTLTAFDNNYYFDADKGSRAKDFLEERIGQAIHATRLNFSTAQRTGNYFWNVTRSELNIQWEHNDISSQRLLDARSEESFTEPALIPMALRANTVYCYYITKRADVTVDKMFDLICKDRSVDSLTVGKHTRVQNLWDSQDYSLLITERAIEALVDYCDYLEKFGDNSSGEQTATVISVDEAVEEKIRQYLSSEKGQKLLVSVGSPEATVDMEQVKRIAEKKAEEVVAQRIADQSTRAKKSSPRNAQEALEMYDLGAIEKAISGITNYLCSNCELPSERTKDEFEKLAYSLMKLFEALSVKAVLDALITGEGDGKDVMTEPIELEKTDKATEGISEQQKWLIRAIAHYLTDAEKPRDASSVAYLYKRLVEGTI